MSTIYNLEYALRKIITRRSILTEFKSVIGWPDFHRWFKSVPFRGTANVFYTAKGSLKKTPHLRRENVCGTFLGLVEGLHDWSRKSASITQQNLHRFNGGLSDSRNTGRRWVFKKLARFGPRVGSFNSLSVFLARSWTHEYFPLPVSHTHKSLPPLSSL